MVDLPPIPLGQEVILPLTTPPPPLPLPPMDLLPMVGHSEVVIPIMVMAIASKLDSSLHFHPLVPFLRKKKKKERRLCHYATMPLTHHARTEYFQVHCHSHCHCQLLYFFFPAALGGGPNLSSRA